MTAKELVIQIITEKVSDLEKEITRLKENLADKEREYDRLTAYLDKVTAYFSKQEDE